jgi:hypothetical protein
MRRDGPDSGHLIRRDGDAQPRSADQERAVGLAVADVLGGLDREVRVRCLVGGGQWPDVSDAGDARVGFEVGDQEGFVFVSG